MKTIRFGIIGCGLMGREFASAAARWAHLTELDVRPEIVAICDRAPALFPWYQADFPSIQQMWAAFLYELVHGKPLMRFAGCVTPAEVAGSHRLFTAGLESQRTGRTVEVAQ